MAIIATGPSAQALDLRLIGEARAAGARIMAINSAIAWLPAADFWFTIDPSPRNRLLMRVQRPGVRYFAAVPCGYGTPAARKITHRAPAEANVTYLRRVVAPPRPGLALSEARDRIWSGNSAYGGFGLAYLMGAEKIALIGVDGTRHGYAYARGRPAHKMWHLRRLFKAALRQIRARGIDVMNGSPASNVDCFPRTTPNRAMEWLIGG